MKIRAALLAVALAVPVGAADRIGAMKAQTVLVTSEGFLGGGRGTGILMDETHVLTCAHMASAPDEELFIYTYPLGTVIRAKIENVDIHADLLLLRLETPVKGVKKPTFQRVIQDGDAVTVIGNAIGSMKWYVTRGIVSGRERNYIMTDAQVHPGNSGGPWFNDKGEIVGLSDWGLKGYPEISAGISAETILATLQSWEDQKKAWAGLMKLLGGGK